MVRFVDSATTVEVTDVLASETFYREKLGFNAGMFYGEPPTFCIVRRDQVTIFLDKIRTPHPVPLNQYWAPYIYVDDVDAMLAEVGAAAQRSIAISKTSFTAAGTSISAIPMAISSASGRI